MEMLNMQITYEESIHVNVFQKMILLAIDFVIGTALVTKEVINACKAYPARIYGDRLQNREKLDQKYFERLILFNSLVP
jgi:hypothetical protein